MLSDIVNGISKKLNDIFGDGCEIYSENVKQGLGPHSFFIKPLPVTNKPLLGKRAQRTYSFVVSYFPDMESMEINEKMAQVSEQLFDGLEYIKLLSGETIRGLDMQAEIVDDVLHFSIKYNVFVYKDDRIEVMIDLNAKVGTKGAD